MVPIGERAIQWIDRYLAEVRPLLLVPPDDGVLFLTRFGEGFRPAPLTPLALEATMPEGSRSPALRRGTRQASVHRRE